MGSQNISIEAPQRKSPQKMSSVKFKAIFITLIASITLAWTFMTPFGEVADEPGYAVYANVVASGQEFGTVVVPSYIANAGYARCISNTLSAKCQSNLPKDFSNVNKIKITEKLIYNNGGPEPYFWVVGQPSRVFSGFLAFYLMRLFAWILGMTLMALMIIFWPILHRASLVFATLLVLTPMVGSFFGAINPNGFEMVSGFALAGLLSALMLKSSSEDYSLRDSAPHLGAIFIAMMALSVAKPYSFLFTLLISFSFLITFGVVSLNKKWSSTSTRTTGYNRPVFLWLASSLVLSVLVGYESSVDYMRTVARRGTPEAIMSLPDSTRVILSNFTNYALELIGFLGWRSHVPPTFVVILWAAALVSFGIYVFTRMVFAYKVLFIVFLVLVFLVVPVFSLQALGLLGGAGFQTRYIGAIFCSIPFIAIAYLILSNSPFEISPAAKLTPALICCFFIFQIFALGQSFIFYSIPGGQLLYSVPIFDWIPNYWVVTVLALLGFLMTSMALYKQLRESNRTVVPV